ncbi:hypothetical protein [Parapedobacter sp.]
MKRQTIYAMLIVAFASVAAMQTQAQTAESGVSEKRIRALQSPEDTEKTALKFAPQTVQRVQMRSVNLTGAASPATPQALREQIFDNYTPPGGAMRQATAGPQNLRASGADKLPSELSSEEVKKTVDKEISPAQAPPTQGNAKEVQ